MLGKGRACRSCTDLIVPFLQIHKATLSARGAARTKFEPGAVVAVKVRHPGVDSVMERDFALMQRGALLSKFLPFLAHLNLEVRDTCKPCQHQLGMLWIDRQLCWMGVKDDA